MPRVSIYVDEKVRVRMRSRTGINWSKVAANAFLQEITKRNKEEQEKAARIIEPLLCFGS